MDRYSGLYIAVVLVALFGFWIPNLFLTSSTLHTIADGQPVTVLLGLAALVPLIGGNFDLSIGATANFTGILAIVVQDNHHWNVGFAIGLALVSAAVIGLVNGFLIVVLHVNSFIATLGMGTVLAAMLDIVTANSQPLSPASGVWNSLATHQIGGFEIYVGYALVVATVCWWLLEHTPYGRYMYAIGSNREASRLAGVRVSKWEWMSMVIASVLSGIAGVLYCSANGPSLTFGTSLLLPAFAACFLGATQLKPGHFNVWGSVIAVYVLAIGVDGLQLLTGQEWINQLFDGIALVAAVSFAVWRQRNVKRRGARLSTEAVSGAVQGDAGRTAEREGLGDSPVLAHEVDGEGGRVSGNDGE